MRRATRVSVPGKLILMGEHAVVYRRPALVAAVDLRARVAIGDIEGREVRIDLPQLGWAESATWASIAAYSHDVRERWERFAARPSAEAFRAVRGNDRAHLVKVALGETRDWCRGDAAEDDSPAVRLTLDSEIPIGSGFGSSAAAAVGIVAAYMAHRARPLEHDTIDRVAFEVERRQHGLPSGVDHATVLRGGLLWATRAGDGAARVESVGASSPLLREIRVFDSGPPTETTGAVVSAVRDRVEGNPAAAQTLLDRMEAATRALRAQLDAPQPDRKLIVELIRDFQDGLERLGVVPGAIREVVRRVEAEGGAAKVSGAGALTGAGAGGLLVYHPDPERVDGWSFLGRFQRHAVVLGGEGLRVESEG